MYGNDINITKNAGNKTMKVLIADDHAIVREGLKQIVNGLPGVALIDETVRGQETLARVKKVNYDFVILDISFPDLHGLDILQHIRDLHMNCRVLILSFHPSEHYAVRAFKLGAAGYISKSSPYNELKEAIARVAGGGRYVSSSLAEKVLFDEHDSKNKMPHENLSEREFQVMLMLASGKTISEIAEVISISDKTVSTYRSRIMKKMRLKTNTDCTLYAMRKGLIV